MATGKAGRQSGFTLIQLSIILGIASLMMVAVLPTSQTALTANNSSAVKMNAIFTALRSFQTANGYLPCPADPRYGIGNTTYYGVQAANGGATGDCTGGTPAADFVDAANNVAIGMVPVHTLGLSNAYALDGFGRDFTYAVDTNATTIWPATTLPGAIMVADNGIYSKTVVALVSHGADGHGAYLPATGSGTTLTRMNAGSTDTDQLVNAHITTGTFPTAASSSLLAWSGSGANVTFVKKLPTGTFDDLVVYNSPLWNLNSLSSSLTTTAPTVSLTAPASNGTYYNPQPLTLTVTFANAVTVTGTPYITMGALNYGSTGVAFGASGVGNATYVSGSGTTALTFTYNIASSDSAPYGLTMASGITLNGGTITVTGTGANAFPLTFSPVNLSGIIIGKGPFYLTSASTSPWSVPADWNSANNSIEAVGCGGSGAGGSATAGGAGGGGGEYRMATNVTLSGTVTFTVPAGGVGTSTVFNNTTPIVRAYCGGTAVTTTVGAGGSGGTGAAANATGGAGGASGTTKGGGGGGGGAGGPGAGTTPWGPGAAGNSGANTEGGGGGGGGSNGGTAGASGVASGGKGGNSGKGGGGSGNQTGSAGKTSGTTNPGPAGTAGSGAGGAGSGGNTGASGASGAGGAGAIDTSWDSTHGVGGGGGGSGGALTGGTASGGAGGTYGGGGGGGGGSTGTPGSGGQGGGGLIIIRYTASR